MTIKRLSNVQVTLKGDREGVEALGEFIKLLGVSCVEETDGVRKEGLTFGDVVNLLREDLRMASERQALPREFARKGWNGRGMSIWIQCGNDLLGIRPYIIMRDAEGKKVPWLASQTDLLADDWEEVDRWTPSRASKR